MDRDHRGDRAVGNVERRERLAPPNIESFATSGHAIGGGPLGGRSKAPLGMARWNSRDTGPPPRSARLSESTNLILQQRNNGSSPEWADAVVDVACLGVAHLKRKLEYSIH
jgi:hypothetical protein